MKKIVQIEPSLGIEEKNEILQVLKSGWYSEGTKTKEFEKKFADFVGIKYATVVTSGTAALFIGLKALGIGKGDEVLVPDLTFVASPNSIEMTGAKPVLVDIEKNSFNLDSSKIEKMITKKTKAIMPVDFNGRKTDIFKIREVARKNNLYLIEDACHAIGSHYSNKHMGTLSDIGVFSFSIPKIITTGQGGMIITNDKKIHEKCLAIKDFGRDFGAKKNMKNSFDHKTIGYNFKFTEFQAAIGLAQLKKLKKRIVKKKKMLKRYTENLSSLKDINFVYTDSKNETLWMMDILLKTKYLRNNLINYLERKNIQTRIFYPPIHRLTPYKEYDNKFRISSNISDRGLWLPSSITLNNEQIDLICNEIIKFFIQKH